MENHASNPAGRLLLYFREVTAGTPSRAVHEVARPYFGTKGLDSQYMSAMAALMRLPDEAEAMVDQLDDPPIPAATLTRPLPKAREVFNGDPLGTNPVSWVTSVIDSGVLSDLETTSHILNRFVTRIHEIPDDTLVGIKSLADEIIRLAQDDSTLDAEARAAIIRYANRIRTAADLYKVTGPQGLIDELDRFYSEHRRIGAAGGKPLRRKLGEMVGAIVLAVGLFGAPADISNAVEYYGEVFELTQLTDAPGEISPDLAVIEDAEVIDEDEQIA